MKFQISNVLLHFFEKFYLLKSIVINFWAYVESYTVTQDKSYLTSYILEEIVKSSFSEYYLKFLILLTDISINELKIWIKLNIYFFLVVLELGLVQLTPKLI